MFYSFLFSVLSVFNTASIYDFNIPAANGDTIHLSNYQGKQLLFVNTAGNSLHADQLLSLQELFVLHQDSLVVIVVPSNSFGNEPGTDSTIYEYLSMTYNVDFLIAAKAEVTGENICPLYNWLTQKAVNGSISASVKNDFQKYLVNKNGVLIGVFSALVNPLSDELQDVIKGIE